MKITLTANAGFLLETDGVVSLLDSFHLSRTGAFSPVPNWLMADIIVGNGRFSRIDAAIITHPHPDHADERVLTEFLEHHPETELIYPARNRPESLLYELPGVKIYAGRLTHDGAEYKDVPNYGFYMETAEGTFLTLGDAALDPCDIAGFLDGRKVTACALNFPFFALSKGREIVEFISPEFAAAVHLPFAGEDKHGYIQAVNRAVNAAGWSFDVAVLSEPLDCAEFISA